MYSPHRLANTFVEERLNSMYRTCNGNFLSQTLRERAGSLEESQTKNLTKTGFTESNMQRAFNRFLDMKLRDPPTESYKSYSRSSYYDSQLSEKKFKKIEKNEQRRAIYDQVTLEENEILQRNITKLKEKFATKILKLEKNCLRQMDCYKSSLHKEIGQIVKETQESIRAKSYQAIENALPIIKFTKTLSAKCPKNEISSNKNPILEEIKERVSSSMEKVQKTREKIKEIQEKIVKINNSN